MKTHNFLVLIEQDTNGWFVARVPELQSCTTQGKTVEEAMKRAKEAIECCVESDNIKPREMRFVGLQTIEVKG
jgi:predicted RNase H-like HicB family nuclease